jgi:colanic acid/amylovoran biosynthesis glycosyltransferase
VAPDRHRLRVAIVVWRFPAITETFILNQVTGLLDRGHEVDIYALAGPGDSAKAHPDVARYRLLERTRYASAMADSRVRRLLGLVPLLWGHGRRDRRILLRALNAFRYGRSALSLQLPYGAHPFLGRGPYHILHCQFGDLGLRCMRLKDLGASAAKLVTSFRGYDISHYVHQHGPRVYAELAVRGDFFLSNCEHFKRRLLTLGFDPAKVVVLPSGIQCSRFRYVPRRPPADGRVRVVTTGRLVEKKGVEYGIRAVAKLRAAGAPIEYAVVGDGPLRPDLEQLIRELGLTDAVTILGWRREPEVTEVLERAHLFISPNVTAANGDEDAPVNVVKEAMATGLPVVGTRHGGIPEMVQDGVSGFLVAERDVDELAARLGHLVAHPELWPGMGQAGRAWVEQHYDATMLAARLEEIYRQLL